MQELIYKQDAHDKLEYMYLLIERDRGQGNEVAKGLRMACKAIGEIEEVDTEPVRHGQLDEDKPLTNGDRIRAMTDEELADFICQISQCCGNDASCSMCPIYDGCAQNVMCVERWLKQEVEKR